MNLFPKHINVNGKQQEVIQFAAELNQNIAWEKDIADFILEWYADSYVIEVQTSGSTGKPKSIKLSKEFVAASARRTLDFFELKENDRVLHCLPTRFIAGKLMLVRALIGQLNLDVIDPSTDFSFLKDVNFKFAAMVPNQVNKLLNLNIETQNPELLLIGGSAIPQSLEDRLQYIATKCYSSYGMTETATHIALRKLNGEAADGFYQCLNGIRIGKSLEGCLQIFMHGIEVPYLQTTDLLEMRDETSFRILGRADHVIISGGNKYFPEKIEKKLESHIQFPFYISSLPDEKLGQQLVLFVEAEDKQENRAFLKSIFDEYLLRFEIPRQIIFQERMNYTETGKIRRD